MTLAEQGYKSFNDESPPKNAKIYIIWVNGAEGEIDLRYKSLNLDARIYPMLWKLLNY